MAESLTQELYFSKAKIMFRQVRGMTVRTNWSNEQSWILL